MLTAETLHPSDLSGADLSAWRVLAAAHPAFASPLLGPDFALEVGRVRDDARVAIWRRDHRPVGFLPHHRRPGGLARPIGSPFSDYHALVGAADAGLKGPQALALAGISAFRFTGLVDPHGVFADAVAERSPSFVVQLEQSAPDYLEALRAASPKRFKNYRRLDSKLDREVGPLRLVGRDLSDEAFETLLDWKRAQLARTGLADFLRPTWTRALLRNLFERRRGDTQGLLVMLYAGEQMVGGHFGVRQGAVYHPWIAATDPQFAPWSPGITVLARAIAAMPELGLTTYDLGPSQDHYKRHYALPGAEVGEGLAAAASPAGRMAGGVESAWTLAGARRAGPVGKLRRRLDVIATTELTTAGRVRGFVEAVAAQGRRRSVVESELG
ncbi:CelD/BcsL family acetyltransferase involved in cellulose biosynthesis [Caulobacter ginsengisoli]|uniref:CelD/BcsL family acetyltransferase involved in cellulose biosynthesis n=1 Tax=Caulobacter ginsengisoli TaxID=400775 RepID=A0ABU0IUM8_9CAUL|nr:GNAT family N-acetyltransferase [Caulobacter ginsengisoli]MDQ0465714.1 CelD/BcsL family acetyltransferase involved in cellulose biosynthesis [Caulobacter ginsengisoli]